MSEHGGDVEAEVLQEEVLVASVLVGPELFAEAELVAALADLGVGAARVTATGEGFDLELPWGAFTAVEHRRGPAGADARALAEGLLSWPADDRLSRVQTTLALAGTFSGDRLARRLAFTRVVAAVAHVTPGAVAVHWDAGETLVPAAEFVAQARTARRGDLPTPAWIGLHASRTPAGAPAMLTSGLAAFGHPELLVRVPPGRGADAAGLAWGIAARVIGAGVVLVPGTMVGDAHLTASVTELTHPDGEGEVAYVDLR